MQRLLVKSPSSLQQRSNPVHYKAINRFANIYKPRGADKSPYDLKAGDTIHGFSVKKTEEIPVYSMKSFMLEHNETKAKYLHLHCPDPNNCFGIGFKTTPKDNKGGSHVLEKLVLCGSERYPVRDPFSNMTKRSLNTFMNAWTGADFTCFPFSTQNEKDFKNLLSVYLESVFRPTLRYSDFMQEAWHYSFLQEENPDSELLINGNIYTQMKGLFQTPDQIFIENLQKNLYPQTPYQFCAGGVPEDLLKLSYNDVKELHGLLYHPSNSFLYSYGDLDFTQHLQFIHGNYLKIYQPITPETNVPIQPRFDFPVEIKIQSPPDPVAIDPQRQSQFGISYLCNDVVSDPLTSISMHILSYILFETPESPMYQALLESGMTTGYCAGYGYDMNLREGSFTIGAKNLSADYGEMMQVENVINQTLKDIVKEGLSVDFIESVLHQIEFQAKLPKVDFGVSLLQSLIPLMNHGGDPMSILKINQVMGEIRKKVRKGKYFEGLIKKYLLENKHKVTLIMTPNKNLISDENQKEKKYLFDKSSKMNIEHKEKILRDNLELRSKLYEIQDVNILPMIKVEDVPRTLPRVEIRETDILGTPFLFIPQPTNGITCFRIQIDLRNLPDACRPYLKFFCQAFPRLGTKTVRPEQFIQMLDLHTYNFEIQHIACSSPENVNQFDESLVLSIACLDNNIENMFNCLTDILINPVMNDLTNLSQLLKIYSSEAANSLVEDSLAYALSYAAAGLRYANSRNEKLENTRFLCDLGASCLKTSAAKGVLTTISKRMQQIFTTLFQLDNMVFCVNGKEDIEDQVHRRVELLCHALKKGGAPNHQQQQQQQQQNRAPPENASSSSTDDNSNANSNSDESREVLYKTFFPLPMQTSYIVEAFPIPHFTHPDTPKLHVLAELITSNILNEEIKENGGAFDGGIHIDSNGVLSFYSYRDPHLLQTYQSFEKGIQWASNGEFNLQQSEEAKIKVISNLDQVELPLNRGLKFVLNGITEEMREEYRHRVLDTTKEELVDVANRYLLEKIKEGKSSQVIFGSQTNDLEGLLSRGWKIERAVEGLSIQEESYEQNTNSLPRLPTNFLV